jgi:hypothetical protein
MFKKLLFSALVALTAASCSKSSIPTAPVTLHVEDFRITIDTFSDTKAVDPSTYSTVKALTLAFFDSSTGEKVYFKTNYKPAQGSDPNFGTFSCNLPIGSYTMVVLGYDFNEGDVLELTSPTAAAFTTEKPRETFAHTQAVSISDTNPVELEATLSRIVTRLTVSSTDGRSAAATNIRLTLSKGSKAFNPTTGLATSDNGFTATFGVSKPEGETTKTTIYAFLSSDTETMDVTIEVLNSNAEVIQTHNVSNVPFQRNRSTKLSGPVYSDPEPSSASFQLNTSWLTEELVNY